MKPRVSRRTFLCSSAAAAAAVVASAARDRVRVGIIGLGRRGGLHAWGFARTPEVHVCQLCDLHRTKLERFAAVAAGKTGRVPALDPDYRRILERPDIEAVAIALPERLRAIAVQDALRAGKHVLLDPNGLLGLRESLLLDQEAQSRGLMIELSSGYAPIQRYLAEAGMKSANFQSVSARIFVESDAQSLVGLELCRRILGCSLPSAISAFEIASVSSAASYMFNVEGVTKSLHWELRRVPAGAPSPRLNLLSVMAEGTGVARFAEWKLPRESDVSFKPGRERFVAFAHAIRRREAGLLTNSLADGRITTALLRLSTVAAQAGRPLRFDPTKERFIGERPALQEKLC